jgi:TonB-linked SusC/RagA family outer membrane protein
MNVKLDKRLSMRTTMGVDYRGRTRKQFYGTGTWFGRQESGYASLSSQESLRLSLDHMFNYNYRKKKNRLDVTAGISVIESLVKSNLIIGRQFSTLAFKENGLMYSNNPTTPRYFESQTDLFSALARVVYSYDNRLVLTSTFRADGTSKFAPGNKFSYFPSFALAYRLDQEEFVKNIESISNLKFRLGWGRVGNQAISNYQTLSQYSSGIYVNSSGSGYYNAYIISNMANPKLKWETTEQYNLGFDFGLFNNRVNITGDVYNKVSHDLLQNIEMSMTSGYSSMAINRGEIQNRGIELSLDVFPIKTKKMSLNIAGNISFNRNKILNIGLPVSQFGSNQWAAFLGREIGSAGYFKTPANIFIEGQPVALFYGLKVNGIITKEEQDADRAERYANYMAANPTATEVTEANLLSVKGTLPVWNETTMLVAGDPRYVDIDQNGNIDGEGDKTIIGNPNPDFTYGFTIDFNYKNFYINAAFNGVYGNELVNSNRMMEEDLRTSSSYTYTKNVYNNYWREDRLSTTYPRAGYTGDAGAFTSFYVEDGSFLRFSNLTLGYNINLKKNKYISTVGLSLSGRNLLVLTKYSGFDPEVSSFATDPLRVGVDWASYPNSRSYSVGVTLDF